MSIHVCECKHNGITEFHLRYPGMSLDAAQELADKINGGKLEGGALPDAAVVKLEEIIAQYTSDSVATSIAKSVKHYLNSYGR
jgi:hypothetical protein